jgi:hypothetical protein
VFIAYYLRHRLLSFIGALYACGGCTVCIAYQLDLLPAAYDPLLGFVYISYWLLSAACLCTLLLAVPAYCMLVEQLYYESFLYYSNRSDCICMWPTYCLLCMAQYKCSITYLLFNVNELCARPNPPPQHPLHASLERP